MSFQIALSGLNAASTDLEVTGNNIANSSTAGFKESRAEFADVYANSLTDLSTTQVGRGVRVSRVAQQFSQGSVDFTSNNLDMALNGEGFFVMKDRNGARQYTRAGAFSADRNGFVVNSDGDKLQIYPTSVGADGVTRFTPGEASLQDLQLPLVSNAPSATTRIGSKLNLDANSVTPSVGTFDPLDPDSYNYSTSLTLYDSQGSSHVGSMYFVKSSTANEWEAHFRIVGDDDVNDTDLVTPGIQGDADSDPDLIPVDINGGASYTLVFDDNGVLIDPTNDPGELNLGPVTVDFGVADMAMIWDLTDTTQFGAAFAVNELDQDGFSTGRLSGVDIDSEGVVFARYTNGESNVMGKVAVAAFNNPQGLRSIGGTKWAESFEAGTVRFGEAGTSNFGLLQSGALESSNVDIATELVDLILAQRNFQANAKVISTSDQITQAIINIR